MVDIPTLFHNFAIQLFSLFFGIIAGLLVGWLAVEEIPKYQKQLGFVSLFLFAVTFAAPLLFVEKWIPLVVVGVTYAILAVIQKDKERFFLLSPLVLFLTTENKTGFFLISVLVFAATGVMTLRILALFVKDKKIGFGKELMKTLFDAYAQFIVVSLILYSAAYFS